MRIMIANAAPWVAVAPCLLVILGRDRGPVAVAAIAVFFFVFVSTTVGLGAAPAAAHDVATALGGYKTGDVLPMLVRRAGFDFWMAFSRR